MGKFLSYSTDLVKYYVDSKKIWNSKKAGKVPDTVLQAAFPKGRIACAFLLVQKQSHKERAD